MSAPGEAALVAYLQANHMSTLNAMDTSGNSYQLQIAATAGGSTTTFNGIVGAYTTTEAVTLSKNMSQIANGAAVSYFLLNPYMPLGKVGGNLANPYALISSSTPVPATLNVGNSGALASYNYYHDQTRAGGVEASETDSYTVAANNASTLLFCIATVTSGVTAPGMQDGLANGSETDCYTVNSAGTATLVSITVMPTGGPTLTFM